jgi:hypothetical protein
MAENDLKEALIWLKIVKTDLKKVLEWQERARDELEECVNEVGSAIYYLQRVLEKEGDGRKEDGVS